MDAEEQGEIDMDEVMLFAANMLLADDDDNDDDDEDKIWVKVSVDVDEYLHMQDGAFRLHFRMCTLTFEALVAVVANFINEDNIVRRNEDFGLRHIMLSVLWILATPDSFRSIALRFGVTPGVIHFHYKNIINALSELSAQYVTWPSHEEMAVLSHHVDRKTGFPGAIAAVDGMHVSLCSKPRLEGQRYVNRHHEPSIVLQAVADPNLAFRDVYVGEPGSLHDSRVFRRSPLAMRILEEEEFIPVGKHILGDGAYILTDKVLTPFRNNGRLTAEKLNYNRRLSSARSMVERAFGRLQVKFRRLMYLSSVNMEFACRNVMASVMLHNFLIYEGEAPPPWDGANHEEDDEEQLDLGFDVNNGEELPDHPNVQIERDHPLLAGARVRGIERRLHVMRLLPVGE